MTVIVPNKSDVHPQGVVSMDVFSRMYGSRSILICGEIGEAMTTSVISQLHCLSDSSDSLPITIYINSPGGSATDAMAIYDTIKYVDNGNIVTVGMGMVASAATLILAAGSKGSRILMPSTTVMIHQIRGSVGGLIGDMRNSIANSDRINELYCSYIANASGKDMKVVMENTRNDYFMSSKEAIEYGIADKIATSKYSK